MKKVITTSFALIIGATVFPLPSIAGTVTGTVSSIIVRESDGLTYFTISGTPTGKPACATNSYWMIKDENSEAGKKQFSLILAAKMSDSTVTVNGANACTRWGDGEDVLTVNIA